MISKLSAKEKMSDYINLNYGYVFKSENLFSITNIKKFNTLISFEQKIAQNNCNLYAEADAHFTDFKKHQSGDFLNTFKMIDKLIPIIKNSKIKDSFKTSFIFELEELSKKEYQKEDVFKIIKSNLIKIAPTISTETLVNDKYKRSYYLSRGIFYLLLSLPISVPSVAYAFNML